MKNLLDYKWDNLIILDACRYDVFEEVNFIKGKLKKIESVGTETPEWMQETFEPRMYDDIVYYTSNPYVRKKAFDKYHKGLDFHKIYEIWYTDFIYDIKGFYPDTVNEVVMRTQSLHRDKKKIIHYLSPHTPFIMGNPKTLFVHNRELEKRLNEKKITLEDIKESYKNTLKMALMSVSSLLIHLEGDTIITSDHGELHGEGNRIGHGLNYPDISPIREVPLLILEPKEETAQRMLEDLGYM